MAITTNYNELTPNELLGAAAKAGVLVTVDCQCPGIFVNGRHFVAKGEHVNDQVVIDGYWCGASLPEGPPPAGVQQDLRDALMAREREIEELLQATGAWSCGCDWGRTADEIAEL